MNTATPNRNTLSAGDVVAGRFVIQERVGAGAMGEIFLALQKPFRRPTAIKVLHPWFTRDKQATRRFLLEAHVLSRLSHPNTVTVLELGKHENSLFIAMEFIDGMSLAQRIQKKGPMPPEDAIPLAIQVAQSLGEAHRLGVVHRDLKPENILISERPDSAPFAKVVDFGIAKLVRQTQADRQTGNVVGTPHFMAPEQARGSDVDGRSDLYSLACCLYEMLTGRPPFDGDTALEIMMQHLNSPRPELPAPLPRSLDRFLQRAMASDPDQRPADAATFVAELVSASTDQADWGSSVRSSTPQAVSGRNTAPRPGGLAPFNTDELSRRRQADQTRDVPTPGRLSMAGPLSRNNLRVIALLGALLSLTGLGLLLVWALDSDVSVRFDSDPAGAVVELNGEAVGVTPLTLEVGDEDVLEGRIIKRGWEAQTFSRQADEDLRVFSQLKPAVLELSVSGPSPGFDLQVNGESYGPIGEGRRLLLEWPLDTGLEVRLSQEGYLDIVEKIPESALNDELAVDFSEDRVVPTDSRL